MSFYLIAAGRIDDAAKLAEYMGQAAATLPAEARVLIADESADVIEGTTDQTRIVVIEFPSRESFRTWYDSPEYQKALPLRLEATTGVAYLAEGFTPPS